jgi:type VI secretion system secreted protein VgrG
MGNYVQGGRLLELATPLGPDILLARSFSCTERISSLYTIEVGACVEIADAGSVKADALIGQRAYVRVQAKDEKHRFFHGIVRRLAFAGRDEYFHYYQLELVPFVWRCSQVANCRIFQNKSIPEIIEAVLGEYGAKFENKTSGRHKPWDYCVQYRESDFNFLSRLMEQEGIFYFFKQGEEFETMIFGNQNSVNESCPLGSDLQYRWRLNVEDRREQVVSAWEAAQELRPGLFSMRDHNFQKPESLFHVSEPSAPSIGGNDKLEIYDYPGEYAQLYVEPDARLGEIQPEGEAAVKRRMQAEETETKVYNGESGSRSLTAGYRFKLADHFKGEYNDEYTLISVHHHGVQSPGYRSDEEAPVPYRNSFRCIPWKTPYVPARTTPKPVVQGPQTAVVVGPSGEEIYVDKYGRVKVQFFWDRVGTFNEKSSCWVRVAQLWAGKQWGAIFNPRIGQEVIVDFLEGDPDQPIITGRVYNASDMPPYTLPGNSTMSTIKSLSSKGGGGFNEFRFEDKKGDEHIYFHAERNFHTRIKKDRFTLVTEKNHQIVKGDHLEAIKGDASIHTTGDENHKVDGNYLSKAGMDMHNKAGMNMGIEGGMNVHIKGGMSVVVEAGVGLTLKVGGNFITLNPAGVQIQGTMVLINSGGAALSGQGIKDADPKDPEEPIQTDPGQKSGTLSQGPPVPARNYSPRAGMLKAAAASGAPFCHICPLCSY